MSAVSAYYYLRVVWYMYFREAPEGAVVEADDAGPALGAAAAVTFAALGVLAAGPVPVAADQRRPGRPARPRRRLSGARRASRRPAETASGRQVD